jgi:hypothetical protein
MPRQPRINSPEASGGIIASGAMLTAALRDRLMTKFVSFLTQPLTPYASRRAPRGQFRYEQIEQIN